MLMATNKQVEVLQAQIKTLENQKQQMLNILKVVANYPESAQLAGTIKHITNVVKYAETGDLEAFLKTESK